MRTFECDITIPVRITVHDDDVIDRVLQNKDGEGVPQPRQKGGPGWQDTLYGLETLEEIIQHLAHNRYNNCVEQITRLDGWGDMNERKTLDDPEEWPVRLVEFDSRGPIDVAFLEEV